MERSVFLSIPLNTVSRFLFTRLVCFEAITGRSLEAILDIRYNAFIGMYRAKVMVFTNEYTNSLISFSFIYQSVFNLQEEMIPLADFILF